MPLISLLANSLKSLFKFHKLKVLCVFSSALMFVVLRFPFEDLSDLVTKLVADQSDQQYFVQFEDLSFGFFPGPHVRMNRVSVDTPFLPSIEANLLKISPSITSLLQFKKGASIRAEGLLGATAFLNYREGKKISESLHRQEVQFEMENLLLEKVRGLLPLPVQLKGEARFQILDADIDPSFEEQPLATLVVEAKNLAFPEQSIPTPIGLQPMPSFKFKNLNLSAKLSGGELSVSSFSLGDSSDDLLLRLKGKMTLRVERRGFKVEAVPGNYAFDIELKANSKAVSALQSKGFYPETLNDIQGLSNYFRKDASGIRYALRVSGVDFESSPRYSTTTERF